MTRFLWVALMGLALAGVLRHAGAQEADTGQNADCATTSLRHETNSAWAGWSCADIDDVVAASETIKAQARNKDEKWGDLALAFVVVILAALAALVGQALIRTVIALIDTMRPEDESPFFLSQFKKLVKKERPTAENVQKMNALARVIAGSAITRALFALVFAIAYLALLTG